MNRKILISLAGALALGISAGAANAAPLTSAVPSGKAATTGGILDQVHWRGGWHGGWRGRGYGWGGPFIYGAPYYAYDTYYYSYDTYYGPHRHCWWRYGYRHCRWW